jgi:hypothetical protein
MVLLGLAANVRAEQVRPIVIIALGWYHYF